MNKKPTVIDFFCWAGWFSEWLRQAWFNIVKWVESRETWLMTHNYNHNLSDELKDVWDYRWVSSDDIDEINKLENTDIIVWSPPCISFSSSNRSWKADKTKWLYLIKCYLRVVAVKKHQKGGNLKFRMMENVANSKKHINDSYSFIDLNLEMWAKSNWIDPKSEAIGIKWEVLDFSLYWIPQRRKRFIVSENCLDWSMICIDNYKKECMSLWDIMNHLPNPNEYKAWKIVNDPNYSSHSLNQNSLTDHFYDTWLHLIDWEKAKFQKTNHPFMWVMSFPENLNNISRTILATSSLSARETFIVQSEYSRKWNWEFRKLTVREASTIMWFPLNYQFFGSVHTKRRQVWNAVCPQLARHFWNEMRRLMWMNKINTVKIPNTKPIKDNLNDFREKIFTEDKYRTSKSKFRRHPFKDWNMTTTLMNYHPISLNKNWKWYIACHFWTWGDHKILKLNASMYNKLSLIAKSKINNLSKIENQLKKEVESFRSEKLKNIQNIYEQDINFKDIRNPVSIIWKIRKVIESELDVEESRKWISIPIKQKDKIPMKQLAAIHIMWKLLFK